MDARRQAERTASIASVTLSYRESAVPLFGTVWSIHKVMLLEESNIAPREVELGATRLGGFTLTY